MQQKQRHCSNTKSLPNEVLTAHSTWGSQHSPIQVIAYVRTTHTCVCVCVCLCVCACLRVHGGEVGCGMGGQVQAG